MYKVQTPLRANGVVYNPGDDIPSNLKGVEYQKLEKEGVLVASQPVAKTKIVKEQNNGNPKV